MKIYTKTGDLGETALFGGARVSKAELRVAAYGDVDELNAAIGLARAQGLSDESDAVLERVQSTLFNLGAELATAPDNKAETGVPMVDDEEIAFLERAIDGAEDDLPALRTFVLPGGALGGASLHVARTVCRRAERQLVTLHAREALRPACLTYLNRLSDLLFVLSRLDNHQAGVQDVPWVGARN